MGSGAARRPAWSRSDTWNSHGREARGVGAPAAGPAGRMLTPVPAGDHPTFRRDALGRSMEGAGAPGGVLSAPGRPHGRGALRLPALREAVVDGEESELQPVGEIQLLEDV